MIMKIGDYKQRTRNITIEEGNQKIQTQHELWKSKEETKSEAVVLLTCVIYKQGKEKTQPPVLSSRGRLIGEDSDRYGKEREDEGKKKITI